ncbi:MAG: hypothetical protein IJ649_07930 [Oscillospiraceae bacterium]|nr:hypothetical protein [Oscillospiraceae bacterium]
MTERLLLKLRVGWIDREPQDFHDLIQVIIDVSAEHVEHQPIIPVDHGNGDRLRPLAQGLNRVSHIFDPLEQHQLHEILLTLEAGELHLHANAVHEAVERLSLRVVLRHEFLGDIDPEITFEFHLFTP